MLPIVLTLPMALDPGPPRPPALEQRPETPDEALLREAKGLRYAQRFYEAAERYRQFIARYPNADRAWEARFWLAATLEQDQRWDEAAAAYTAFLQAHPDQRMLVREAKLNRVRCWGLRQGQHPEATPGLVAALKDDLPDVRVLAALQLAKRGDLRAVEALQAGLSMPAYAEAASTALIRLGVKPKPTPSPAARFLVIRIQEVGQKDPVTIRLALSLARALENYLSDAQIAQARRQGISLEGLIGRALEQPKGTTLLAVEDGRSKVTITVE